MLIWYGTIRTTVSPDQSISSITNKVSDQLVPQSQHDGVVEASCIPPTSEKENNPNIPSQFSWEKSPAASIKSKLHQVDELVKDKTSEYHKKASVKDIADARVTHSTK